MINSSVFNLPDSAALAVAMVDGNGDQLTGFDGSRPANAAVTAVPSSLTSVVLLAANPARRQVLIVNRSTKTLHIQFGAAATVAGSSFFLGPNANYEGPLDGYTGVISGIWTAVNGQANVTEVTL